MNVYLYTAHITVSQGGLQFYLSEIGRHVWRQPWYALKVLIRLCLLEYPYGDK